MNLMTYIQYILPTKQSMHYQIDNLTLITKSIFSDNQQVRFKQTKNIENLKTDLTTTLQPSIGPFRHIYTPAGGTEVTSLDQIEKDKEYVAGQGNQNFRKLSQVIHKNGPKGKKKSSISSVASSSNQVSEYPNSYTV